MQAQTCVRVILLAHLSLFSNRQHMLKATKKERDHVVSYVSGQAPDETVELAQKVYSEQVLTFRHDIWDVHTNVARWWVLTNPMNLYRQDQFPNMDLALTFHVGLCIRIPRSEHQSIADLPVEPLLSCWRTLEEAGEALSRRSGRLSSDWHAMS